MDNESIRNIVMLELIQPSRECLGEPRRLISEEEGRELYKRYKEGSRDWTYVFGAIKDEDFREKMINLYKELK